MFDGVVPGRVDSVEPRDEFGEVEEDASGDPRYSRSGCGVFSRHAYVCIVCFSVSAGERGREGKRRLAACQNEPTASTNPRLTDARIINPKRKKIDIVWPRENKRRAPTLILLVGTRLGGAKKDYLFCSEKGLFRDRKRVTLQDLLVVPVEDRIAERDGIWIAAAGVRAIGGGAEVGLVLGQVPDMVGVGGRAARDVAMAVDLKIGF